MAQAFASAGVPRRSAVPVLLGLPVIAFVTLAALAADQPLAALSVPLLFGLAFALWRLPLKVSAIGLMALVFFGEGLEGSLGGDMWSPPGELIGRMLLLNMNAWSGISVIHAPLADVLTVGLYIVSSMRDRKDGWVSRSASVRPLNLALLGVVATLFVLYAIGAVRGGNMSEGLWQFRHTLMFPLRAVVLLRALDGTVKELKTLAKVVIAVTFVKSLIGIYFLRIIVYGTGRDVEFTTSHTDTLLFVPVLALFFNLMIERFTFARMLRAMPWVLIVLWGMVCNDRRLAYVSLAFAATTTVLIAPWTRFKRILFRTAFMGGPFFALYTMAGWTSTGGRLFFLARLARSIVVGDPNQGDQADYRDLENVDVLSSWANAPIIPNGYGHKFNLLFPLPDISRFFPQWQYHAHNQYLWTMAIAGPVGFTFLMLPLVLTLFFAARTYRFAQDWQVRVAMLTCIAIVIAVFSQWYGDMGGLSFTVSWMGALAFALTSKWAMQTGAWVRQPARVSTHADTVSLSP